MNMFFLLIFCIFAVSSVIKVFYYTLTLMMMKQKLQKFGYNFCSLSNHTKGRKCFKLAFIADVIAIITSIFLFVLTKEFFILIFVCFGISKLLMLLNFKITSKHNGFYQKGIIFGKFIKWEKINSWEKINEFNLLLKLKDGRCIKLYIADDFAKVEKLFIEKLRKN